MKHTRTTLLISSIAGIMILILFFGASRLTVASDQLQERNGTLTPLSTTTSPPVAWANERVIAESTFDIRHDALVVDLAGKPHIFYGRDHLYHAYLNGVSWQVEIVDPAWGVGSSASAAIDKNGHFHVSYFDDINNRLKYAYNDGLKWTTSGIVNEESLQSAAIAVDSEARPHVAFSTYNDVYYAKLSGGSWQLSNIENRSEAGRGFDNGVVSIAVGNPQSPHITYPGYRHQGSDWYSEIRHAQQVNNSWNKRTIVSVYRDSAIVLQLDSSVALDQLNRPHIAYDGCWQACLEYTYWNGNSWIVEDIHATGTGPSLFLDKNDTPYVSFHGGWGGANETYVAAWNGATWNTQTVLNQTHKASLGVDALGERHLAVLDLANYEELRYLSSVNSWTNPKLVDVSFDAGWSASLTLSPDATSQPHISYGSSEGIQYTTFVNGVWESELVDDNVSSYYEGSSIALQPSGSQEPCIAYKTAGLVEATRIACRSGGNWVVDDIDIVGGGWNGHQISLAFEPTSPYTPHVAYSVNESDVKEIRHAHLTSSGWLTETVDSVNYSGFNIAIDKPSLAIDSGGQLHLAYARDYSDDLMYAFNNGSGWQLTSIGTASWLTGVALQLDAAERPNVLWGQGGSMSLLSYDSGIWSSTPVDSTNNAIYVEVSLDFDDQGQAHISYYRGDSRQLYYALVNDQGSQVQLVDNLGDVGRYSSIAVDHYGHPRIAHYDESNGDLKFSWQAKTETIPSGGGIFQAFESATLEFPAGVFTDTVVMTTTLTQPFGTMPHIGVFYDLEALYEGSGSPAEIQPGMTYTVTIHYDEAAIPPLVNEAELALYYWDGNDWLLEPTSQVNVVNNILSATPNHFSIWAGLFEDHRVYLPNIAAQ